MDLVPFAATLSTDGFRWRSPLPPYQKDGIARLLAEPGVLLADEMGLGKTIQAIGALRVLLQRGAPGPALVVVPIASVACPLSR
jgi:SNF2 family DNA or RNA helicase